MITKKYAYQRVRTRSERTKRNLLALIEVVVVGIALRGVLELAVVKSSTTASSTSSFTSRD
jgi:hypothetical protein